MLFAQTSTSKEKTVLDKAHDRTFAAEEFLKTQNRAFQYKIYNIEKAITNKTHHWFFQLTSLENNPLNFANIILEGYLKSDPVQDELTYEIEIGE